MATDDVRSKIEATDAKWGLGLSETAKDGFTKTVSGFLSVIRSVENVDQALPEVKYPRDQGYRPPPEENVHNAWYYKTEIRGASSGKLSGKRVAIKDNVCVAGVPMMNGSRLMEGFVPQIDATVVTRILDAGATITGKTACEDLCFSGNSFTCATGPVLNPNDVTRSSGGSSSGSAVLVRTGAVDMAVGGDQGGSIRMPSSYTGIVGMKATYGLVPYTGAMGLMYTCDHLGPMASNVHDCALLLEVMAGPDGIDPRQDLSITIPDYSKKLKAGVKRMKIGLVQEAFGISEPEVTKVVRDATAKLGKAGATVSDVSVPHFADGGSAFVAVAFLSSYSTFFEWGGQTPTAGGLQDTRIYERMTQHMEHNLKKLSASNIACCMIGEALTNEERHRLHCYAQNGARALRNDYNALLDQYDVLIMPTTPTVAAKLPEKGISVGDQIRQMFMMTPCTEQCNLTHHPALSMQVGEVDGLPVGMMIVGKFYHEQTVFNVAYTMEQLLGKK